MQVVPQYDSCNRSLAHYMATVDCGRPQLAMLVKQIQPSAFSQIDYGNESPIDLAVRKGATQFIRCLVQLNLIRQGDDKPLRKAIAS